LGPSRQDGRIAVVGLAVVLVGLGAGFVVANRGPDCLTLLVTTRDVDAKIDPTRDCVVAIWPVGSTPGPVVSSAAGLWVANLGDSTLTAIDPVDGPRSTTAVLGTPVAIAADQAGAAYALLRDDQTRGLDSDDVMDRVAWIDIPGVSRRSGPTQDLGRGAARYESIVFASELAWISDGLGERVVLVRFQFGLPPPIDVEAEGALGPMDTGGSAVWLGDAGEPVVYRVDGPLSELIPIPIPDNHGGITAMDATDSAVWLGRGDGSLTSLDPGTNGRRQFALGDGVKVTAVAAGPDAIWVADDGGNVVLRVDPATDQVSSIPIGGRPGGIAVAADGSVWVTIQSR
jgi:streptogramin lyase